MNPQQLAAFCVWYKQGISGHGQRSFTKTAEITNIPVKKIYHWSRAYDWQALAEEKDSELNRKLEEQLMSQVVEAFHTAVQRQRLFAGRVWKKIFSEIDKMELSPDWILSFMEYELALYEEGREGQRDSGAMNLKVVVENHLSKEARGEFLSAFGKAAERKFIDG